MFEQFIIYEMGQHLKNMFGICEQLLVTIKHN